MESVQKLCIFMNTKLDIVMNPLRKVVSRAKVNVTQIIRNSQNMLVLEKILEDHTVSEKSLKEL